MLPRFALIVALAFVVGVPLTAGAAQPNLSAADKAAVGRIYTQVSLLNPKLAKKAHTAVNSITGEYTKGCKAKYDALPQAKKQVLSTALTFLVYLRFVRIGFPVWNAFAEQVKAVPVSNAALRRVPPAMRVEQQVGAKFAQIKFTVCDEMAKLANAGFTAAALDSWATALGQSTNADTKAGDRADAKINATRPLLRSAGLTATQAKLMTDSETGDIFHTMLGLG